MFEFKHQIEFQNNDTFSLFGEDFFGDKSTFWESHQTSLNELYKKVINSDFPIKITDLIENSTLTILDWNEFKNWLKINQPFSETINLIESRNEIIYSELLKNCRLENTDEFEFYWEVWGVMWYPWTIEINNKFQTFSLNDISENDLTELVKLKKIELIKTYEN
uniref:hypothetical protein n=1 Tax=Flavobacterium sp. TaxID=239 RepID=UPI002611464F